MIEFFAKEFIDWRKAFSDHHDHMYNSPPKDAEAWKNRTLVLIRVTKNVLSYALLMDLKETIGRCNQFLMALENSQKNVTFVRGITFPLDTLTSQEIVREMRGIEHSLDAGVKDRRFLFIPAEQAQFLEQDFLFGAKVNDAFPSAATEIRAAGNCLSLDLGTAAVFHLMRAVEVGLRALARQLKVKLRHPIEESDWAGNSSIKKQYTLAGNVF